MITNGLLLFIAVLAITNGVTLYFLYESKKELKELKQKYKNLT